MVIGIAAGVAVAVALALMASGLGSQPDAAGAAGLDDAVVAESSTAPPSLAAPSPAVGQEQASPSPGAEGHDHEADGHEAHDHEAHDHEGHGHGIPGKGSDTGSTKSNAGHHHSPNGSGRPPGPYINEDAIPGSAPGFGGRDIESSSRSFPSSDFGEFRTECAYSHMNWEDPIVFPGQRDATHLHTFFGNTRTNYATTAATIATTGNSTCTGGIINRSAYWVPTLLDEHGVPQVPMQSHFYYKGGAANNADEHGRGVVQAFPAGIRILTGASMDNPTRSANNVWWECHGLTPMVRENFIPRCPPSNSEGHGDVVMVIEFPQCWDGVNLDSADHRSHMAFPRHVGSGRFECPSSHPVVIPHITYNIHYKTPPGVDTSQWRLSSDMYMDPASPHDDPSLPHGLSLHADWFNGWEQDIVEEFVENCLQALVNCGSHRPSSRTLMHGPWDSWCYITPATPACRW